MISAWADVDMGMRTGTKKWKPEDGCYSPMAFMTDFYDYCEASTEITN